MAGDHCIGRRDADHYRSCWGEFKQSTPPVPCRGRHSADTVGKHRHFTRLEYGCNTPFEDCLFYTERRPRWVECTLQFSDRSTTPHAAVCPSWMPTCVASWRRTFAGSGTRKDTDGGLCRRAPWCHPSRTHDRHHCCDHPYRRSSASRNPDLGLTGIGP